KIGMFPSIIVKEEDDIVEKEIKEEEKEIKKELIDGDGVDSKESLVIPEFELYGRRMDEIEANKTEVGDRGSVQSRTDYLKEVIETALNEHPIRESKETLRFILHSVLIHKEISVPRASQQYNIAWHLLFTYTEKIRLMLLTSENLYKKNSFNIRRKMFERAELVTVHGLTVPRSISVLSRLLDERTIDFSQARPFDGTAKELNATVVEILRILYAVDFNNLGDAICMVHVDGRPVKNAIHRFNTNQNALTKYSNVVKIFIDFNRSPCTHKFQLRQEAENNELDTQKRNDRGTVTIDGITTPLSRLIFDRELSSGRLDNSQARPFKGTREELKSKLKEILEVYEYAGEM
ncbi:hypothetical protein PFISCL1PPCAC_958, partial [Pristionchus fissidentatus]